MVGTIRISNKFKRYLVIKKKMLLLAVEYVTNALYQDFTKQAVIVCYI